MKTIDERLEALTERHESLTMSVQLLLAESQEHTKQLELDGEHVRALVRIAEIHERRLTAIEGAQPG